MRTSIITLGLISSAVICVAHTPPGLFRNVPPGLDHYRDSYKDFKQSQQAPMNPGPAIPPGTEPEDQSDGKDGGLTISDVLPRTRSINIFAGLTRDIESVSGRLESTTPSDNTTLLAPLNSAIQNLPRKPWEDRPGDPSGVSATRDEEKAADNLKRFVLEHVVPTSPWKEGKEHKIKSLGGQDLWWEQRNGKRYILPGEVEVSGILGRVGNGEVWALKGVINYQ